MISTNPIASSVQCRSSLSEILQQLTRESVLCRSSKNNLWGKCSQFPIDKVNLSLIESTILLDILGFQFQNLVMFYLNVLTFLQNFFLFHYCSIIKILTFLLHLYYILCPFFKMLSLINFLIVFYDDIIWIRQRWILIIIIKFLKDLKHFFHQWKYRKIILFSLK